ncbi:MAG: hypothetical protein ABIW50_08795 [Candidatus Limnocylindria bacterium]
MSTPSWRPASATRSARRPTGTPADLFGRVSGRHVSTGANAALADAYYAVLVFDRHDPLAFDADLIADVLDTGRAWADRVRDDDPHATNYLLIWNCLGRAGGSIVHGHAQALIGSGAHHEQLERLRRDVLRAPPRHGPHQGPAGRSSEPWSRELIEYDAAVFELRRDPVTGWWAAIVADRPFDRDAFAVEAQAVEGTHCRHCDDAEPNEPTHHVRRVPLRSDAFHRIDSSKKRAAQLSISEVERATGSWEILVGPRDHHERMADAAPQLASALIRAARDAMRALADEPRETDSDGRAEPLYIQVVQSHGRQAGSRSSHLNVELYAIPQVPHWVAEEIGGGARQMIKARRCVWCALAEAEEENDERLVFADHHAIVFAPAASRSAFELMVVPRTHAADFTVLDDEAITATTATLQRALLALDALGNPPYNLFLHTAPAGERLDQTFHWHWEIHPRLRVIAGLERATALAVNPVAPEYAAEVLRAHLDR